MYYKVPELYLMQVAMINEEKLILFRLTSIKVEHSSSFD